MVKSNQPQSSGNSLNLSQEQQEAMVQRLQELEFRDFTNSLLDERTFRYQMIQELKLANQNLIELKKVIEVLSSEDSDEDGEETPSDDEEDEEEEIKDTKKLPKFMK